MIKNTLRYFDVKFYLRFASIFLGLYLAYTFVIAAAAPTGTYFPFVEKYLNFPVLIRYSVLHISQFFLSALGFTTTVFDDQIISGDGSKVLEMAWPCYGLGLKSFWIAFVCAHQLQTKQKFRWSLYGIFLIFFLNCVRVTVLMISMIRKWSIADYLGTNAHDLFNYLCYAALLGLILLFYSRTKGGQRKTSNQTAVNVKPISVFSGKTLREGV